MTEIDDPGGAEAIRLARDLFLREDNNYGCAESALVALQELYGFEDADDSSAAMALNGGVAYSGGVCGAISGAAMAVGRLAAERIDDHREAKATARKIVMKVMGEFRDQFGSHNCRDLIDYEISIPSQHDAFIESGVWHDTCMKQVEFSVGRLAALSDQAAWEKMVASL